ncbi:MAG: VOC family protein [Nannocystaceae bacterium]|nr:VOC family protein [Nannocystaceae bacterium]
MRPPTIVSLLLGWALSGCATASTLTPDNEASENLPLSVDHVGLTVSDLEASKTLFVDVLGFTVLKHDASYPAYILGNGASKITLWRASDPEQATPFDRKNNVGLHHLAFAVSSFDHLEALHQTLAAYRGVTIEFAPELAYGGPAKHMMFREPSGNRVELVHRPAQ